MAPKRSREEKGNAPTTPFRTLRCKKPYPFNFNFITREEKEAFDQVYYKRKVIYRRMIDLEWFATEFKLSYIKNLI